MRPKSHAHQQHRHQVIEELRHQLRYANESERTRIRQELNFWLNCR